MLYPDFNDLIELKERISDLRHASHRSVKSPLPGNRLSPYRGQGLEFDSVREYVAGDDIRCIDWRVTARTGAPHLKLFREERERHISICVDMNAAMRFGTRGTFKSIQAARVAALLGWQGIDQQDRVGACLFGDVPGGKQFFAPMRTRKAFCALLKTLAAPPEDQPSRPLEDVLPQIDQAAHAGSLIYLISDFMHINANFPHEISLNRLSKRCDVVLIAINDPADKSIFPFGNVGFCANDQEKIQVNTKNAAGREAYALQWEKNRQLLSEATSKWKIPLIELTTESDIPRDLMLELKNAAKRKKR